MTESESTQFYPQAVVAKAGAMDSPQIRVALFAGCVVLFVAVISLVMPLGVDYALSQGFSDGLLDGTARLYSAGTHYYDAPWLLAILIPLTRLPATVGEPVLVTLSVLMSAAALRWLGAGRERRWTGIVFGFVNLHTFSLLYRGQVDAFVLFGIGLGWYALRRERPWVFAAALWFMSVKPQNVLLLAPLFLYAIRRWPLASWLRALSLVVASLVAACALFGLDWPWRYLSYVRETPPGLLGQSIDLWRVADHLAWPEWPVALLAVLALCAFIWAVRRFGLSQGTLSIALVTCFVFSVYSIGYQSIVLLPALVYVARHNLRLALAVYLFTWTPLFRLWYGFDISWIDAGYPIALLLASWWVTLSTARAEGAITSGHMSSLSEC